jgi:hypothetical protein
MRAGGERRRVHDAETCEAHRQTAHDVIRREPATVPHLDALAIPRHDDWKGPVGARRDRANDDMALFEIRWMRPTKARFSMTATASSNPAAFPKLAQLAARAMELEAFSSTLPFRQA